MAVRRLFPRFRDIRKTAWRSCGFEPVVLMRCFAVGDRLVVAHSGRKIAEGLPAGVINGLNVHQNLTSHRA